MEEKTTNFETRPTTPFIHLRNHSQYSILKALTRTKDLAKKAKEFNMPALALTDYNNMYGAIEFYKACKENKVKPILGVEMDFKSKANSRKKYKLVFLAKNNLGYKSLMHIVSVANLKYKQAPHLTFSDLQKHLNPDSGLVVLSGGGDGEISDLLVKENFEKAKEYIQEFEKILGEKSFYLEIVPQTFFNYAKEIQEHTLELAKNYLQEPWRLIATQNPHYLSIPDRLAQRVVFNIHGEIEDTELFKYKFSKEDFSFLNTEEATTLFQEIKNLTQIDLIQNTFDLAETLQVELTLGEWHFPNIQQDYEEELLTGKTLDDVLKRLAEEGIVKRKIAENRLPAVIERLNYELGIIKTKGYAPYFLTVYDLLKYASDHGILTNIRGSVAGSITTYLLFITKCDPLIYQIPFERFLNPERPSAPDIDMDYADNRRDEVIDYVRKKYGKQSVAQIGTFGTMQARGAVKDVARAMKYSYTLGDKISKLIPMPRQGFPVFIETALKEVEELKKMYDTDREVQTIINMAKKVEGLVRHVGVHAAGVVIAPENIENYSPIQYDPKVGDKIITQYDMHSVDEDNAGLLKFDFLGIRNLTILKTAMNLIQERYNLDLDVEEIDLEDKKTFELLSNGETIGLFQLNGSGMTKFLKELQPTTIFDINALVALYRPGPIANIPLYIERKRKPKLVSYLYADENLKEILEKTFGVLVYQDDLLLMSIKIAGYSWGEADKFRKAVGKKIPEVMEKQREKFINGCVTYSNWPLKKAEELWNWIAPFAAYGFNKAHSASYGRVAYQTAFLKANYPVAFLTAILTEESQDIDKVSEIVEECRRLGIEVLPPNVNYSFGSFRIVDDTENLKYKEAIRFGLYTIKNLGKNIAENIMQERLQNGTYKNLEDFIHRIKHKDLNRKSLESLIKCGALDEFGERGEILFNLEDLLEYHRKQVKANESQNNLFSLFTDKQAMAFRLKKCPPSSQTEKLAWEKELIGSYISGSPLDKWKDKLVKRNINIQNILEEANAEVKENQQVSLPVLIDKIKITKTKRGEQMALLRVSDLTGRFEVAVFPKVYKNLKPKIILNLPLILTGKIAARNNEKTLVVDKLEILK